MANLYILTFIIYCMYAYLPFLNLQSHFHYISASVFAILGSTLWVTISRSVDKGEIALYGLYFDAVLTLSFLLVPLIAHEFSLNYKQIIGILLILIGILLSKL